MSLCRAGSLMELQAGPARSEASHSAGKRNFKLTAREAIRKLRVLHFQKPKHAQSQHECTIPNVRISSSNIRLTTVQTMKPSFASAIFRLSSSYRSWNSFSSPATSTYRFSPDAGATGVARLRGYTGLSPEPQILTIQYPDGSSASKVCT